MGQYYKLVNLDKKQWIHAHQIGNGLKLAEQKGWKYSTETAGKLLIQAEKDPENPTIGLWAGDKEIAFIGDSGCWSSLAGIEISRGMAERAGWLYSEAVKSPEWTNISGLVTEMMIKKFGIQYKGDGWLDIIEPTGVEVTPNMTPDMILRA